MKKFAIPLLALLIALFIACSDDDGGTGGDGDGDTEALRLEVDMLAQPSATDVNVGWAGVDSVLVDIGATTAYGINPNLGRQNVILKAVVRDDILYIRAKWHDATANLWANYLRDVDSATTGNFEQATTTGEDKFLIIFDGQNNGTERADCASMCHVTSHHTTGGGNVDAWKWLSTKTAPGFLAEDEWWDGSGRTLDDIQVNTYVYRENWDGFGHQPEWMHETGSDYQEPYLYLEDVVDYNPLANWEYNSRIPGYGIDSTIFSSATRNESSRWNVTGISEFDSTGASSAWTWTVVFSRALNTGHADDVNLADLDSVQIAIAATHNDAEATTTSHSGAKPLWLILKP